VGKLHTDAGDVPRVSTKLHLRDRLGWLRVRCGIGRYSFRVNPGLYAVGSPSGSSNVFVTANYKMSFDKLRSALKGRDAWILVLDTKGINVWCAAGKGTFGTEELVERVKASGLERILEHRQLILPQLGASAVSAHKVSKELGFKVIYGPVRATDISAFLSAGLTATREMRAVSFNLVDRVVLTPVELGFSSKYMIPAMFAVILAAGFTTAGLTFDGAWSRGGPAAVSLAIAWLVGAFAAPILLPYLPGRAFSVKGAEVGLACACVLTLGLGIGRTNIWETVAVFLVVTAIASFLTMTFAGASACTSPSGVKKETRIAVPFQAIGLLTGAVAWGIHILSSL
jgi:acetyl-CoA decarbonylase/synthase complex subunit gamma